MCVKFIQFLDYFKTILQLVLEKGLLKDYSKKTFFTLHLLSHVIKTLFHVRKQLYQTRSVVILTPLIHP